MKWDELTTKSDNYDAAKTYYRSRLANALFCHELSKRSEGKTLYYILCRGHI